MKNFGNVNHNKINYYLTEQAYENNHRYYANATDEKGKKFMVIWETTKEWKEALEEYKATGEYSPLLDDEYHACNWDSPIEVIEL